jgi:hypothetical protein
MSASATTSARSPCATPEGTGRSSKIYCAAHCPLTQAADCPLHGSRKQLTLGPGQTGSGALAASATHVQPPHMSENRRQSLALAQVEPASLGAASEPGASPSVPASAEGHDRSQQHLVEQGWSQGGGAAHRTPLQMSASGGPSAASPDSASAVESAPLTDVSPVLASSPEARELPAEPQSSMPAARARPRSGGGGNLTGVILG